MRNHMCGYVDSIQINFVQMSSSSESEEQIVYEEDEVLWAKIRGYPWWPAYVTHLNLRVDSTSINSHNQETDYTVIFFGDNTQYFSAKLGPLKLRKFIEFYTDFYPKAKTNRKLMGAIQMAEERLRQNDQEVEVFEEMRSEIKSKNTKKVELPEYKFTKSDPVDNKSEEGSLPLKKSRSCMSQKPRGRQIKIKNQMQSQQQSLSEEVVTRKATRSRQIGKVSEGKIRQRPRRLVPEEIFEEQEEESHKIIMKNEKMDVEEDNHKNDDNSEEQKSNEEVESRRKRQKKSKAIVHPGPRRRGRPRKYVEQVRAKPPSEPAKSISVPAPSRSKAVSKRQSSQISSPQMGPMSESNQALLRDLSEVADSREDLIQYIEKVQITTENVKEILDMNVSNILQNGPVDSKVKNILNVLKSALLLKYFPEDLKHLKKYQKLSKKKSLITEPKLQKSFEASQSSVDMQIRKKTTIKLQHFLKQYPESGLNTKQTAIKIESKFFKIDNEMGSRYKKVAYDVLSSIKDKRQNIEELIERLQISKE